MTLKQVKEDIQCTIDDLKEVLERYQDEECGVDKHSGHYGQTSGYIAKIEFQAQLNSLESVLSMLNKVGKK